MRRLLAVVASVAMLAPGGAFAGEVKGPPGTPNNTNSTGALRSRKLGLRRQRTE